MARQRLTVRYYQRFTVGTTLKGKAIEERAFRRDCLNSHAGRWKREPGYTPLFSVIPTIVDYSKCYGIGELLNQAEMEF